MFAPLGDAALRQVERVAPADEPELEQFEHLDLLTAAERLRTEVAGLALPLDIPGVDEARRERRDLLTQLDDYVLPRLRRMDAPLLAVIGGSTGAGKSTLTNSLVRREVSRAGVLRPTTRSPVLVHHPYDSGAFLSRRILPGLERVTQEGPEPLQPIDPNAPPVTALRLVPHEGVSPGLAIVDAPDIDSLVEANRELAVQLLGAADLWLFVTTASRYSDAIPWQMLRRAVERGVSVAIILDRVPPEVMQEVRMHVATLLRDSGLGSSPMFTIAEMELDDGMLPVDAVRPLLGWLHRLARDTRSREVVVRRTLAGIIASLPPRVNLLAAAAEGQAAAASRLQAGLDAVVAHTRVEAGARLSDGTVLRGEVLARWQEFLAAGEFLRNLESPTARLRERLSLRRRERAAHSASLSEAIDVAVHDLIRSAVRTNADRVAVNWRAVVAGVGLIGADGELPLPEDLDATLADLLANWRATVLERSAGEARDRRAAGSLSLGTEGAADLAQLVALGRGSTLTGGAPVASALTLARRILDFVYGDGRAERLISEAALALAKQVDTILIEERARLESLLEVGEIRPETAQGLHTAMGRIDEAH